MTSRDFCFWLQGFFELQPTDTSVTFTHVQVKMIRAHLNLVFLHEIDPSMPDFTGVLQAAHDGVSHLSIKQDKPGDSTLIRC